MAPGRRPLLSAPLFLGAFLLHRARAGGCGKRREAPHAIPPRPPHAAWLAVVRPAAGCFTIATTRRHVPPPGAMGGARCEACGGDTAVGAVAMQHGGSSYKWRQWGPTELRRYGQQQAAALTSQ